MLLNIYNQKRLKTDELILTIPVEKHYFSSSLNMNLTEEDSGAFKEDPAML